MRRLVIGHSDLDGVSLFLLFDYFEIPTSDRLALDYEDLEKDNIIWYALTFDEIFFIDITPSGLFLDSLLDSDVTFFVFDHHEERVQPLLELPESPQYKIYYDADECGTSLFYKSILGDFDHPETKRIPQTNSVLEYFIQLVKIYDLWMIDHELWEEALSLNRVYYASRNYNEQNTYSMALPFLKAQYKKFTILNEWKWLKSEEEIITRSQKIEQESYEKATAVMEKRLDTKGRTFLIAPMRSKISLICAYILYENPDTDYMIVINTYGGGINGKLSGRSSRGFDCTSIAALNGHKPAAGGRVLVSDAYELWQNQFACLKYNDEYSEGESYLTYTKEATQTAV